MGKALTFTAAAMVFAAFTAAHAADGPTRAFINANCQKLTDACTRPISDALTKAAAAGKIPAACFKNRPPLPGQSLDIALWLFSHHEWDNKPLADSAVSVAEKLWPCSRATP